MQPNINIITRGGKIIGDEVGTSEKPIVIRLMLLKNFYDPKQQKDYYKDATKIFRQLVSSHSPRVEKWECVYSKSPSFS